MKIIASILLVCFLHVSCQEKKDSQGTKQSGKNALMEADKSFSALSEAKGMKAAFIEYIDSNGVLLRPAHMPIVGANAIEYLLEQNDSSYILTWQPQFAEVAASGELGYTYGVYQLQLRAKDTSIYGSYVSIWKQQKDGKWKFVLDTGNEGLSTD